MKRLEFTSASIPVVPFEDDNVNPGILGRGLADWVTRVLAASPFAITEDIAEDWGYCLMVHRKPFWLWVGCAGSSDFEFPEGGLTPEVAGAFPLETVTWSLWVTAETGWLGRLLGTDDRATKQRELWALLESKLETLGDVRRLD